MGKYDRTCVVCGKHYEYCTNCDQFINYPSYMTMYCSKECVDLFDVLSSFEAGQTSKEDARKVLQGMDQGKMKMLKNSMAGSYKKIMAEDPKNRLWATQLRKRSMIPLVNLVKTFLAQSLIAMVRSINYFWMNSDYYFDFWQTLSYY